MAQRQFRSDDTSPWQEGFGTGFSGDLVISSNTTSHSFQYACTGTIDTNTLSVAHGGNAGAGLFVLIHQTMGTGAGNWELNKVTGAPDNNSVSLAYPLTNTYGTGAQMAFVFQQTSITLNSGITWTPPSYTGTTGGILAYISNGPININGTITVLGCGFRGSQARSNDQLVSQGEGTGGAGTTVWVANGNGAGGVQDHTHVDIQGGAGGGHASSGALGTNSFAPREAGGTVGNTALTSLNFGGAGAGAATSGNVTGSSTGGNGGGIVLLIGPEIIINGTTGSITANGGTGSGILDETGTVRNTTSGAGAGGSILLKGRSINIGTNRMTALGGTAVAPGGLEPFKGGDGGTGRIHIDYSGTLTGSSVSPNFDSTFDPAIKPFISGGNYAFLM